jgi:release factor glutamine methyltransferase
MNRPAATSIDAIRRDIAGRFREGGLDTPDLDARLVVGHAVGLDHGGLVRAAGRLLDDGEIARIAALAARRLAGEPVARIVGVKEFWGLPFRLSPAVLVPRPETETVVERALAALDRDGPRSRPLRIADLGVGSGAILIALLTELPNAAAIGTDRDPAALTVARDNACRLGVADRAQFAACDFGAALAPGCHVIVTNPPYIRSGDIATLDPEVGIFDPRLALDGGRDGIAAYRSIAADARRIGVPGAHLIAEIGKGQEDAVAALFASAGFVEIACMADLSGIVRVISGVRKP